MKQSSASNRKSRRTVLSISQGRKVIWAGQPFDGRLGRYIGIALDAHHLSVAIATPEGPRWIPAPEALCAAEAQAWAASGFSRASSSRRAPTE